MTGLGSPERACAKVRARVAKRYAHRCADCRREFTSERSPTHSNRPTRCGACNVARQHGVMRSIFSRGLRP